MLGEVMQLLMPLLRRFGMTLYCFYLSFLLIP